MLIERPKPERVQVTAIDPDGEKPSKTITVYETDPKSVIELLEEAIAAKSKQPPRKSAVASKA